jgi:diacylglycerol O-acyltransferase
MALLDPLSTIVFRLPASLSTALIHSMLKGTDLVTSNVPGVPVACYLAGTEVISQYAFGPMAGAASNVTLLSYRDQVHLGINTDPAAVPDRDVLVACLRDEFDQIRKLV